MTPEIARIAWIALVLAVSAIRAPYLLANRRIPVASRRRNVAEEALFVVLGLAAAASLAWAVHPFSTGLERPFSPALAGVGVALSAPTLLLFWRSHADLGRQWSLEVQVREDHHLIERGVYARIRHPMYASLLLMFVVQGLLIPDLVVGWAALAAFVALLAVRIPREESLLRDEFGAEWERYRDRTWRLAPGLL
jgi:protein-S-isoprenylcysteine O-methyltransferase Ste14